MREGSGFTPGDVPECAGHVHVQDPGQGKAGDGLLSQDPDGGTVSISISSIHGRDKNKFK